MEPQRGNSLTVGTGLLMSSNFCRPPNNQTKFLEDVKLSAVWFGKKNLMLTNSLGQWRSALTCYKYQIPNDSPTPNFRPQKAHFCTSRMRSQPQLRKDKYIMTQIVHLGPWIFRPQIIWPDQNCRPQISKLAPRSKSQRVPSPPHGIKPDFEED